MRIAFVKTLFELAKQDKRIMLLTADLGFSVFEEFIEKLPKQYLNAGVAEQNMTGVAAGMAMQGKIPIIYSIIPFVTMRNFEQVRDDICYQNLNVKIVGVGSGFSYGPYGHTHYGLEDVGIMRTIPGITIFAPGDPIETELATRAAFKINGPVYIRIGKAGEQTVHTKKPLFNVGEGIVVKKGTDVTIFTTGTMLPTAVQVSESLDDRYSVGVISMPTIKPFDEKVVLEYAKKTKYLFSLEEHFIIGGLGSAISEVLAENRTSCSFKRIGVPDKFSKKTGNQNFMRELNGITLLQVSRSIEEAIRGRDEEKS